MPTPADGRAGESASDGMHAAAAGTSVALHRSLATRSFLAVATVLMLVMGGLLTASVVRDFGDERRALGGNAESLAGFLATVSPEAMFGRDFLTLETLVRNIAQDDSTLHAVFIDTSGATMTRYVNRDDPRIAEAIDVAGSSDSDVVADQLATDAQIREVNQPVIAEGVQLGEVRLLYSLEPATRSATRSGLEALAITIGTTVLMLALVLTIFRRQVRRPLRELTTRTNALAAGDFAQDFDEQRDDEIGVLQRAFANMSTELASTLEGLELARDEAEAADRAKSQFLANMSHEIRTPLNALLGLTELLLDTEPTSQQREMLATMHNSGDALLAILNEILDYSKLENGHFDLDTEPFSPADLLISATELFGAAAAQKQIEMHTELASDVPAVVSGDRSRVRQVLLNLVGNAVKFTPEGSVRVSVTSVGYDDRLRFAVTDTGIGIEESRASRLFEPFRQGDSTTTRRFGGTGLGLAISNRLVEAMGGVMSATGTPGVGSTFAFEIPLPPTDLDIGATLATRSADLATDADMGARHPLRILLAEDNPVNQMVAGRMLDRLGYSITTADDGVQAVAAATGATFDLVLMDISMPGLDGVQATEQIRAALPSAEWPRIVAFTAHALEGDREFYLRSGMDGYLTKPIRMNDVIEILRNTARLPIGPTPEPYRAPSDADSDAADEVVIDVSADAVADPFDRDALVAMFGDDVESMLDMLVPIFLDDAEIQLAAMDEGLASGDDTQLHKGAHSLKGASASMALPHVSAACRAVETATNDGRRDEVAGLIAEVRARIDELIAARPTTRS